MADMDEGVKLEGEAGPNPDSEALARATTFLSMIAEREKEFEQGWWKSAKASSELYCQPTKLPGEKQDVAYNILYSNTEVLVPSLYSATPKPDVRSRFKDVQLKPIPEVIERFLQITIDGTQPGFESFNDAVEDCVLSTLVAASGVMRMRLYEDQEFPLQFESVGYKHFLWGKARKWSQTPWIAFKHELTKTELAKQFRISEETLAEQYSPGEDDEQQKLKTCCVYEFWHKPSKTVYFLSEEWRSKELLVSPDPMRLKGFYPTPGPLMMTRKPNALEPIPLYEYYRNQAEELNRVTVRLNKVLSAIRVKGFYNAMLGKDLQNLLADEATENSLVAAEEAGFLAQTGGIDKQIWMLPIEKLIIVAQQLYQARESIKQVIYELTGISDIIRGSNAASETATASDLKNKWGTIRLRKMQTIVANYVRDLFRLAVDCGAANVPAEIWKRLVQLPIPTQAEKAVAMQQVGYSQMTGQPPDPELQKTLASPSMEEILEKINSDMDRTFTVNIQTASTIDLDTSQDKAEVSEFMNAMGQLLAGLQPLGSLGPSGIEAAKQILIAVCQRYKFGLPLVDVLQAIQPPPPPEPEQKGPPPPSPEEQEALKAEFVMKLQKVQMDTALNQAKHELALAEIQAAREKLSIDTELARLRLRQQQTKVPASASAQ